jgi:hypothetical protein|tara:strand:+ start:1213 stop:1653 length:441 start_codon:yes stop_codon:yes gene_type:complete
MEKKTISLKDVKTPKTVEEFRENLRKYYMCIGDPKTREELFVQGNHRVKIDELKCLSDLYKIHPEPKISPMLDWDMKDVTKHMDKTNQIVSSYGFFDDEKNYTLYESQRVYHEYGKPSWVTIDNQILREFYVKTLGNFSGYVTYKQ